MQKISGPQHHYFTSDIKWQPNKTSKLCIIQNQDKIFPNQTKQYTNITMNCIGAKYQFDWTKDNQR